MWLDDLPDGKSWTSLWSGYSLCGICRGIRTDGGCPGCGAPAYSIPDDPLVEVMIEGVVRKVHMYAVPGAEGRIEDYIYLELIEKEWKRPPGERSRFYVGREQASPSPRASIVLLYWAYFESRIDRLFKEAFRELAERVAESLLSRYPSIGARLDRLYRTCFGLTYFDDLKALGFEHIASHLFEIQVQRNRFAHGFPEAINDQVVESVVRLLKDEHESWIAVFNKRATAPAALLRAH